MTTMSDETVRCSKLLCRNVLPPWNAPPHGDGAGLCVKHEYAVDYTRRRALSLILRERNIEGDGQNHRLLYLAKAVLLVALFPRKTPRGYPCYEVVVATCDYRAFPDDYGGSWQEVAIGWGWRPRSWRWEWRSEST